jgi:branched-chain amino acid transport system substrate-binding protein
MTGDPAGTQLGKYQIQAEIGQGGMGTVYLAYDPLLDRRVAVKVLAPHLVWEKEFVERFLREARAAARLKHPNIVTIYDVGQDQNRYYFVMEYVEGGSLSALIRQRGALPPAEVVAILRPLADALDYAHRQGLVHRDIKPGNIMVGLPAVSGEPAGHVTLTDFGIARAAQDTRLTSTGMLVGTPEYMSPEQARGEVVDHRTDQYSLGVVAYEMLSGQTPFGGTTPHGVLYKQVFEQPPPICQLQPGLPAGVETALGQALAKDPGQRYVTVTAFAQALTQALGTIPPVPPVPTVGSGTVGTGLAAPVSSQIKAKGVGERPEITAPPAPTRSGAEGLGTIPTTGSGPATPVQPPTVLSGASQGAVPVPATTAPSVGAQSVPRPPVAGPVAAPPRRRPWVWALVGLAVLVGIALVALVVVAATGGNLFGGGATPTGPAVVYSTPIPVIPTHAAEGGVEQVASPLPSMPLPAPPAFECPDKLGCVTIGPKEPIRIAYMLVLSGPDASLGVDSQRGVEMAVDDRKEVLGHPIELVGQDTQCTAEGGQAAAEKLSADPQLVAVVGTSCSSEARVAIPIMCERGIAMVSSSNTAPELTNPDRPGDHFCYLRTAHNDQAQAVAAAQFAWETLKVTRAATIHDGSPYSNSLQQMFADMFTKLGGTITAQQAVDPAQTEMGPALIPIRETKPELVYYPVFIQAGAAITRQARGTPGLEKVHLMSADGTFSPDFLKAAGDSALHMFYSSPDFSRFGDRYQEFAQRYWDRYGEAPIAPFHAHAYDAATMILAAIEKVTIQEPDGTLHIPRLGLIDFLFATKGFPGLTGELSCNPYGDCGSAQIAVYEVVNADPASWNPGPGPDNNPRRIWP